MSLDFQILSSLSKFSPSVTASENFTAILPITSPVPLRSGINAGNSLVLKFSKAVSNCGNKFSPAAAFRSLIAGIKVLTIYSANALASFDNSANASA